MNKETFALDRYYGSFGGSYAAEILMPALIELEEAYLEARQDISFQEKLGNLLQEYAGRPTPLYHARKLGNELGLKNLYLKREDLNHTGSHKINNTLGQALLAKKMGKKNLIAETGAGQHGVATATAAALLGLNCSIFMGAKDVERQKLNVYRMEKLGAKVLPVTTGSQTLKDATSEALRFWAETMEDTYYLIGSVVGPHPFPLIVREFQKVIGMETRSQLHQLKIGLPACLVACVGGGSNAMGLFAPFIGEKDVALCGIEAGGTGEETGSHSATLNLGRPGVLHGSLSYLLQDEGGQVLPTHSVAAGLDYPGVGPGHSHLKETKRATYVTVRDDEALEAFELLCRSEGIIPALESAHALAYLPTLAKKINSEAVVVLCLSGRGDKDVATVAEMERSV